MSYSHQPNTGGATLYNELLAFHILINYGLPHKVNNFDIGKEEKKK